MVNEFLLLTIAHVIAVASPGADFAVVLKNTLNSGKVAGIFTAVGVGLGISIHLIYTIFGIALLLLQSPVLYSVIKVTGALYLLWIASQAFRSRAVEQQFAGVSKSNIGSSKAFRQGFFTNVFNPKVTVFFLVLFTNIVSSETSLWIQTLYGMWLVIYTIFWFILVAWTFSRGPVLAWYKNHGHYIDWSMGIFLSFIALKLLLSLDVSQYTI